MRVTDIRPERLNAGHAAALARDVKWLLQRKDDFVSVSCVACGSKNARWAFEKYSLTYVTCVECGTMYVNPRPTPEVLEAYYARSENYKYWNEYIFPASEKARREKIFRPRTERVARACQGRKTLMEVGAGYGTFCEEVRNLGLFSRVIAVEPVPSLAETCRRKGLEVIEAPIEKVNLEPGTVDVLVSFEVIEHLFSPKEFLLSCVDILGPKGLLILSCPNVRGFDIVVLQKLSSAIGPEHLNYFHLTSLARLVEECGLRVLEVSTPGKLDAELVRKKILTGDLDISSQPFLRQVLIDEWERVGSSFQQFLADNLLSSHMWLIGGK